MQQIYLQCSFYLWNVYSGVIIDSDVSGWVVSFWNFTINYVNGSARSLIVQYIRIAEVKLCCKESTAPESMLNWRAWNLEQKTRCFSIICSWPCKQKFTYEQKTCAILAVHSQSWTCAHLCKDWLVLAVINKLQLLLQTACKTVRLVQKFMPTYKLVFLDQLLT